MGQPTGYSFDATTAVNGSNNTIDIGGTALSTGDAVLYNNGGGNIGGLTSGSTPYYVIVNPAEPGEIQLATSRANALSGTAVSLTPVSGSSSIQTLTPVALTKGDILDVAANGQAPSGQGTGDITINAQSVSNPVVNLTLGSGGAVTISASVSDARSDGTTSAYVGDNTTIGNSAQAANSLTVTATGTDVASDTAVLGSGGLGTGRGSDTEVHVTPTISTFLGQNVTATVANDLDVVATSTSAEGHATANSYGGGGVDVGAPTTTVVTSPSVLSSVGVGSSLTVGGNFTVQALAHADPSPGTPLTDFIQGVDSTKDTINFPDYGLQNGAPVIYQPTSATTTPIQTPAGNLQQYETNPDGTFVTDSAGNKIVRTYHILQVVNADSSVDPNNLRLGDAFVSGPVDAGNLFPTYNFDATSAVDSTSHFLTLSGLTLQTGDAVVYNNNGGTSIGITGGGTLQNGGTYYVIVDPAHPGQVKLADSLTHAQSGTALALLPVAGSSSIQSLTPTAGASIPHGT